MHLCLDRATQMKMEADLTSDNSEKADIIQSVAMGLRILETLAAAPSDLGVTALAEELDTTKSRIHRHLRTLLTLGYISQSRTTERYRIGNRLIALGRAAADRADLTGVAQPYMRKLRDATGHAVSLGQIDAEGIRILSTLHGTMQIEVGVRAGSLLGFTNSAQGKVALSAMDDAQRDEVLADGVNPATEYTITDLDTLRAHIGEVAAQGWATAPNETMLGLNALACPIFDAEGKLAGTVALVSLTEYIRTPPDPYQIAAVKEAALGISAALGMSDL